MLGYERAGRGTGHRSLGVTCVVVLYGVTLEPGCADDPRGGHGAYG